MKTKVCSSKKCDKKGKAQPASEFYSCSRSKDKLQSQCKTCSGKASSISQKKKLKFGIRAKTTEAKKARESFIKGVCGNSDLNAINLANFNEKVIKRALEINTASKVRHTGGFIGITGPAAAAHVLTHSKNLRSKSIIMIAETDTNQRRLIREDLKILPKFERDRVMLIGRDIFVAAKDYGKKYPNPDVPMFSFVHLDFCITAETLIDECNFIKNIKWLARWNHLKNNSYLDITVCRRNSTTRYIRNFFSEIIPAAFESVGWDVNIPDVTNYQDYDGAAMINAFFKIRRK